MNSSSVPQPAHRPRKPAESDEKTWWDFWNSSYRAEDGKDLTSRELFEHVAALVAQVSEPKQCRVLEVACGSGGLSRLFTCGSYHGIDISPAAIEIARSKQPDSDPAHPRTYEAADFHDLPIKQGAFDLVICVDAIVCFRDQELVLRKIAASLRPGGKLIVTAVNPFVYNRISRSAQAPIENGPVSHWLSRAEFQSLIRRVGLRTEQFYSIMPRGNRGVLRVVNSPRIARWLGPRLVAPVRRLKEFAGLGQYFVVVAQKVELYS